MQSIHSPFHSKKNKLNYIDRESVGGSLFTFDWVSLTSADPVPANVASQLERINRQFTNESCRFSSHCQATNCADSQARRGFELTGCLQF